MSTITKERADELDAAWQAADSVERLRLSRMNWISDGETTDYWESKPSELERAAYATISSLRQEVETLRKDRDLWELRAEQAWKQMDAAGRVATTANLELVSQRKEVEELREALDGMWKYANIAGPVDGVVYACGPHRELISRVSGLLWKASEARALIPKDKP